MRALSYGAGAPLSSEPCPAARRCWEPLGRVAISGPRILRDRIPRTIRPTRTRTGRAGQRDGRVPAVSGGAVCYVLGRVGCWPGFRILRDRIPRTIRPRRTYTGRAGRRGRSSVGERSPRKHSSNS